MRDAEYAERWKRERPHVPMPLIDGQVSSISLEQIHDEDLWSVRRHDSLYQDTSNLCGGYVVPPFQRRLVWTEEQSRAFVESAWLGFHLGTIVVNQANDDVDAQGRFPRCDKWLIDGQQRLTAIMRYVSDGFAVFVGTEHEHRWSDLKVNESRRFGHIQIGISRIRTDDEDRLRQLYNMMAFGGTPHTEEERA